MKYIVKTPSPNFEGTQAGIHFRKGATDEIELTEVQIKVFKEFGYEINEIKEKAKVEAKVEAKTEAKAPAKKSTKKSGE